MCIEHRGTWGPRAPGTDELGPLHDRLVAEGVRLQLVRRHGRADPAATTPTTVLLGHAPADPARAWLRRVLLDDPAELADLVDPAATTSPTPPSVGEPVTDDVWLVCTHGRRDACCAVHGRPVAAALAASGAEVWETTHTGGHRFAATAVLLPDGLALGRLDTVDPAGLASTVAGGTLPPGLLRGRCAVPRPVQAAEALAREQLGVTVRDGLLPVAWSSDGDRTTVELAGAHGRLTATVRSRPVGLARPVSDGAPPTTPTTHELVAVEHAGA